MRFFDAGDVLIRFKLGSNLGLSNDNCSFDGNKSGNAINMSSWRASGQSL